MFINVELRTNGHRPKGDNVEFGLRSWLFPKGGKAISRTSCDVELFNYKLPINNSKFVIPSFFSSEHSDD